MTAFFKKYYRVNIIYSLVLIALGIIFTVWPDTSRTTLVRLLGIVLLIVAAAIVILYFMKRSRRSVPAMLAAAGVLAVLGVLITFWPENFTEFVIVVTGIFIMLSGIMNYCQTVTMATLHYRYWWIGMALSVLTVIFSVLVITRPALIADAVFTAAGIFMICDGISDLWTAWRLRWVTGEVLADLGEANPGAGVYTEPEDLMDELP